MERIRTVEVMGEERTPGEAEHPGVDPTASIGDRAFIHRLARVSEFARVGSGSTLQAGAFIGPNVLMGQDCIVQSDAVVQESTLLEEHVRIGQGAVLHSLIVRTGAAIGAQARCFGPAVVGRWAVVAPGAVVTRDVPDYAVVEGSPAHHVGWMGRSGYRLARQSNGEWLCPNSGDRYLERDGMIQLVE